MAIETQCPHCKKSYRLKDELAGKRVTCGNPACRKPFTVDAAATANGAVRASAPQVDAEAVAAAVLGDEPEQVQAVPDDKRKLAMTCAYCDHRWEVLWSMQGKNVLCPDCRTRQKVPEQKQGKVDWRDPRAGRPTLAKVEELEGAVGTVDVRHVSGRALEEAGVLKEELEPRPLRFYVTVVAVGLALVAVTAYGIVYLRQTGQEGTRDDLMARAVAEVQELKDAPIPPSEIPLVKAGVLIEAGEFAARKNDPARLKEAIAHFTQARKELESAPPSPGRDLLFCELAVRQVLLGGDESQVADGIRIRWTPGGRQTITEKQYNVQQELQNTLMAMRREDRPASAAVRHYALRRLARELAGRGQPGVLTESLIAQAVAQDEFIEVAAQVAVELLKATDDRGRAAADAQMLIGNVLPAAGGKEKEPAGPSAPPTVLALLQAVDVPLPQGVNFPAPPPAGDVPDATRQALVTLYLLQKKEADALQMAERPGRVDGRLSALALIAEWSSDPGPAVQAAQRALPTAEERKKISIPDMTLVRLAAQAGRASQPEAAEAFAKAINGDGYRAWARAEALRLHLAASGDAPADESRAEAPTDPKEYRIGHAWGRLALARHNARATGDSSAEVRYEQWEAGALRPFGLAGLALGLQDRALR
jgi:ssDNA-binding Zn-finger/Zn-ribbon topoisomerase 1